MHLLETMVINTLKSRKVAGILERTVPGSEAGSLDEGKKSNKMSYEVILINLKTGTLYLKVNRETMC